MCNLLIIIYKMSDDGYKVQLNFEDEFQDLKSKDLKNLAGKIA